MMTKRISYLFYLRAPKKTAGELLEAPATSNDTLLPIYFRITVDGQRAELSTGESVNPDNWKQGKNRLKRKYRKNQSI